MLGGKKETPHKVPANKVKEGIDWGSLLGSPMLHAGVALLGTKDKRNGLQNALRGAQQGQQFGAQMAQQNEAKAAMARQKAMAAAMQSGDLKAIQAALLANPDTAAKAGLAILGKIPTTTSVPISPEETAALGLPKGTVAQRNAAGEIKIIYKPTGDSVVGPLDEQELGGIQASQAALQELVNNPDRFAAATGPIQGGFLGSAMSEITGDRETQDARRRLERISSNAVLEAASKLKGAASDRDIELVKSTAPSTKDHPSVWIDWWNNEVVPKLNRHYQSQYGISPLSALKVPDSPQPKAPSSGPTAQQQEAMDYLESRKRAKRDAASRMGY